MYKETYIVTNVCIILDILPICAPLVLEFALSAFFFSHVLVCVTYFNLSYIYIYIDIVVGLFLCWLFCFFNFFSFFGTVNDLFFMCQLC